MLCPLCASEHSQFFYQDKRRSYQCCQCCGLVYVEPEYHLTAAQEKAEYDKHQNSPDDQGYRDFLSRLTKPLQQRLPTAAKGLDFGCGPGPTLSVIMAESGWDMSLYDLYYHPDRQALTQRYDFITATEVVEHLAQPRQLLDQLWAQINPQGYLALMTKLVIDQASFAQWHYKNDPTHITFFSKQSFYYLAQQWSAELSFIDKDVIFIKKVS